MKFITIICLATFLTACTNNIEVVHQTAQDSIVADTGRSKPADTVVDDILDQKPAIDSIKKSSVTNSPVQKDPLAGKHELTLQWIGWDRPGSINFTRGAEGWYQVKGQQRDRRGNYLTIEGKIKPTNDKDLHFIGKIISKVDGINDGEPCVRDGEQVFLSTQGRKYWRLQSMLNCEGNRVTDYIDIYF